MNRPWQTWLAFALCAGLALAALGWLTHMAVRADLAQTRSNRLAQIEQNISLVLWRMDTKLAPLIAEEVARPVSFFRSENNFATPANSPFGDFDGPYGDLLETLPENVILNFRCPSEGKCESPQVPNSGVFGRTEESKVRAESRLDQLSQEVSFSKLVEKLEDFAEEEPFFRSESSSQEVLDNSFVGNKLAEKQLKLSPSKGKASSFQQRAQRYEDVTKQQLRSRGSGRGDYRGTESGRGGGELFGGESREFENAPEQAQQDASAPVSRPTIVEGVSRPIWVDDKLLLVRRVVVDGNSEVQGSWLDWDGIRKDLLEEAAELLPNASLSPVYNTTEADPTRMLAGLPAMIDSGEKLVVVEVSEPMRWALWIAWLAFLFALLSTALLLAGVLALSERRAAFVSSVTHELRSPLTTFRMYSDMLSRGMVPDAERRQQYLETLRTEAERLTHLVENVLAYARLERGRKVNRQETVTVEEIIDRLQERLHDRAAQSNFELKVDIAEGVGKRPLTTEVSVVEQILFNLVDNACKYATTAADRTLHWEIAGNAGSVAFTIRDHGPGFDAPHRARRMQAFSKTSEEAAVSAPGVGLGLALCRKLAKQLGGRLEIADSCDGVAATLYLPTNTSV